MHRAKILHRDIKTANILLNNEGRVVVADFGMSLGISKNIKGDSSTLLYRAPEQLFTLKSGYGLKSDVWALGCVLMELLTGKPLFHFIKGGENSLRTFFVKLFGKNLSNCELYKGNQFFEKMREKAIKNRFRVFLKKIWKEDFDEIFLGLLERIFEVDPKKRISVAEILEHEFFNGKAQGISLPVI